MTITESKRKHNDSGFDNHKVFIYKEDFHKFIHAMKEGLEHIHSDLSELDVQDISTESYDDDHGRRYSLNERIINLPKRRIFQTILIRRYMPENEENPQSW